jgi:AcrR family transcriptional regulator
MNGDNMCISETENKILNASIVLFSQKGFSDVTTKEIAKEAGVCEMTLFRHFESKQKLFEKTLENFLYSPKLNTLFESLEWDLENDLIKISSFYQETLAKNQKIILMNIKNEELYAQNNASLYKLPHELKKLLCSYFEEMRLRVVVHEDPEILALSFLATNFGLFMTSLVMKKLMFETDIQVCISNYVKIFARGIT